MVGRLRFPQWTLQSFIGLTLTITLTYKGQRMLMSHISQEQAKQIKKDIEALLTDVGQSLLDAALSDNDFSYCKTCGIDTDYGNMFCLACDPESKKGASTYKPNSEVIKCEGCDRGYMLKDDHHFDNAGIFFCKCRKSINPLNVQEGGDHYKKYPMQPIEYTTLNNLSFCQGNIIKYATRFRDKGGIEDLLKIKHYVDMILFFEYGINNPKEIEY
jgi:hypothetical protein